MRALRQAAAMGNLTEVKRLHREIGGPLNEAGPQTLNTALHQAAKNGHLEVVEYLLKCNVHVDPQNRDDNSPLSLAIQNTAGSLVHQLDIIKLLLNHGANPILSNSAGITPLMQFIRIRDLTTVKNTPHLATAVKEIIRQMKKVVTEWAVNQQCSIAIRRDGTVVFGDNTTLINDPVNFLGNVTLHILNANTPDSSESRERPRF